MRSRETGFAEEADLLTVTPPYPPSEPEYWLDTYPVMMETLAVKADGVDAPQDVALEMAILVNSHSAGPVHPSDAVAVQMYVKEYVAVG